MIALRLVVPPKAVLLIQIGQNLSANILQRPTQINAVDSDRSDLTSAESEPAETDDIPDGDNFTSLLQSADEKNSKSLPGWEPSLDFIAAQSDADPTPATKSVLSESQPSAKLFEQNQGLFAAAASERTNQVSLPKIRSFNGESPKIGTGTTTEATTADLKDGPPQQWWAKKLQGTPVAEVKDGPPQQWWAKKLQGTPVAEVKDGPPEQWWAKKLQGTPVAEVKDGPPQQWWAKKLQGTPVAEVKDGPPQQWWAKKLQGTPVAEVKDGPPEQWWAKKLQGTPVAEVKDGPPQQWWAKKLQGTPVAEVKDGPPEQWWAKKLGVQAEGSEIPIIESGRASIDNSLLPNSHSFRRSAAAYSLQNLNTPTILEPLSKHELALPPSVSENTREANPTWASFNPELPVVTPTDLTTGQLGTTTLVQQSRSLVSDLTSDPTDSQAEKTDITAFVDGETAPDLEGIQTDLDANEHPDHSQDFSGIESHQKRYIKRELNFSGLSITNETSAASTEQNFLLQPAATPGDSLNLTIDKTQKSLAGNSVVGESILDQTVKAIVTESRSLAINGEKSITLEISPVDMGRLEIHVNSSPDAMKAHIVASEHITSELLIREQQQLLNSLRELGIDLPEVEISYRDPGAQSEQQSETPKQTHEATFKLPTRIDSTEPATKTNRPTNNATTINIVA